ncbi:MAG: NTP transferase domain-containing protein, partial [Paracoccaceae bacterium]
VIARLEPQVERLAVSANGDAARLAAFSLPVLPDDDASMGPLSGILAALRWAGAAGADAVISAPVDCPFLPGDLAPRLLLAGLPAMASSGGHDHPVCALWPTNLAAPLQAFLASGVKPRVTDFLNQHGVVRAPFPDDGAFQNVNAPADLAAAEARLA